jgi:hypothetical protein
MKMSTNKAARTVTAALLLAHLGVASAQLFTITHRPVYHPVYHNALDIVRNFEDLGEALHDLDVIFDTLSASQRQVKVHEQVIVDDNRTSHLRLSVHEHGRCKDSTPIELSNVSISVLDDQLTVEAETKHGTLMRSYTLPEHALPDNLTATYTSKMELHVVCPTYEPPSHEPRHIHVTIDEEDSAPPNAPAAPDTKQGHAVHQHEKRSDVTSSPAASDIPHTQGQRADASTTENVVGNVAGNTDKLARSEHPTQNRLDVQKYIQTLEADLARLKSML